METIERIFREYWNKIPRNAYMDNPSDTLIGMYAIDLFVGTRGALLGAPAR